MAIFLLFSVSFAGSASGPFARPFRGCFMGLYTVPFLRRFFLVVFLGFPVPCTGSFEKLSVGIAFKRIVADAPLDWKSPIW